MLRAGCSNLVAVRANLQDAPAAIRDEGWLKLERDIPGASAEAIDPEYYAAVIRRCAVARGIVDTARRTIAQLHQDTDGTADDFDATASECQRQLAQAVEPLLRTRGAAAGHQTWAQTFTSTLLALETPEEKMSPCITTTFVELDRIAEVPVGELTVIGARPGVGKSSLFTRLLYEYGRLGMQPHGWCLEDSLKRLALRALAQRSGVDLRRSRDLTRRPAIGAAERFDVELLTTHCLDLMTVGATWDDTPGRTVEQIRLSAREAVRGGAKVLLLDHALKIRATPGSGRDTRERLNHVIGELSEMAAELQVATIVFTQIRRLETDRPPVFADLKESGKWEEDARLILLLHREGAGSKPSEQPTIPHPAWVTVAKANHDGVGAVKLMFEPKRCLWREQTVAERIAMANNGQHHADTGGVM